MKNMLVRLLVNELPKAPHFGLIFDRVTTVLNAERLHSFMEEDDRLLGVASVIKDKIHHYEEDSVSIGSVYFDLGVKGSYALCGCVLDAMTQYEKLINGIMFIAKPGQYEIHPRKSLQGLVISQKAMADYIANPTQIWA